MRLIIGTYRGRTHIVECLASIERFVTGVDEIVFVDDSDNPFVTRWLSEYGPVMYGGGRGYANTMQLACSLMRGKACAFWEEDFIVTRPIDLEALAYELDCRPSLAQVALLREAWFPAEVEAGGVVELMRANGIPVQRTHDLIIHEGTFTTNPAVWSPRAWRWGWPQCAGSEDVKSNQLKVHDGLRFAYLDGIALQHKGERSGHGY